MLAPTTILALVGQRFLLWSFRDRKRGPASAFKNVLIYGAGETGRLLAQRLLAEHRLEILPVGFLDDDVTLHRQGIKVGPGRDGEHLPVLGAEDSIADAVRLTGAQAVFLATPSAPSERISDLIARLESQNIPFFFVPSAGNLMLSTMRLGQVAGIPVLTRRLPASSVLASVVKRAVDVVGALALLLLTAPVLGLAALLIRLTSRAGVLFTQTRIGLNGVPFTIYKLRTMCPEAPPYALHPRSSGDPRVTRVGYWLRRFSIDELPQLFNVLKSEMSLVGPRPEMPFVVDRYNDTQLQRLSVKPGITGLWQISADRAYEIHDNIHYDLYYVDRHSTTLDLAIMILTPLVLLARNRAM
jgi:exopolysaccharide biosynthesis polyprenyl glycosylphosphotransferase